MTEVRTRLPANGWQPRPSQRNLWRYLEGGGTRAAAVWHRRSGKDEVCLHWSAIAAHQRVGTYWHMLPEAEQARKAIWNAVDEQTGIRRIDQAFPRELRANTNDQQMFIRFHNGSTWQVVGSDNYNSLVGSPPIGVVFSEWSIANPQAWAYMRPILANNGGYAVFVYTPRGRNHGETTYDNATRYHDWFAELLRADETGVFTKQQLARELQELMDEYGPDLGLAYYNQEYNCSFSAAVLGSVYGYALEAAQADGRITSVPYDPSLPVHVSFDLGYSDATAIWFFQILRHEVRFIDYYEASGHDVAHYADVLRERGYRYNRQIYLPWDAKPARMEAGGRSIQMQFFDEGFPSMLVPSTKESNQIQAARQTLKLAWFDEEKTKEGRAALGSYHFDWNPDKRTLDDKPIHDWSSHGAKAFAYGALMWQKLAAEKTAVVQPKYGTFAWMLKVTNGHNGVRPHELRRA